MRQRSLARRIGPAETNVTTSARSPLLIIEAARVGERS
jgi:hypothetical protein